MQGLTEVRARFDLLRAVHPIIYSSLPNNQHHESLPIQDDITLLRSDIRSLPIKLQQVQLDRVSDHGRLVTAFDGILSVFEGMASEEIIIKLIPESKGDIQLSTTPFPQLEILRSLGTQNSNARLQFPTFHSEIKDCREHLKKFEDDLYAVAQDAPSRWDIEINLEEYTSAEISAINDAHEFCIASSSLFAQLVASITCQEDHLPAFICLGFKAGW